jgi:hypothetical protein
MKTSIETSHGIAILGACFLLALLFINWAGKQIDSIALYIPAGSQTAQAISSLSDGLVAHYTFDEGSGTTAGDSAGSNTGTLVNGPVWNTTDSKVGSGALQFDGSNDYVNAGKTASLNITGALTLSAWVKTVNAVNGKTIVQRGGVLGTPSAEQYALFFGGDKIPRFSLSNGTIRLSSVGPANSAPNGVWNHIVGTYNGTDTTRLYINGVQVDTDTTASFGSLNSATRGVGLGAWQDGATGWINGSIDDVRIYNKTLTADEISQLYALGGGSPSSTEVVNETQQTTTATLTVSKSGTGSGNVTGIGISCGSDCTETVNKGTSITLSATFATGSTFQGWSGGSCTGTGTCAVTLNANTSVTATFNTQTSTGPTTYNVKQDGTGNYTTIQSCANVAKGGDTCLVYPGRYPEHVVTKFGGTDDSHRVIFKANGTVTMQGFQISHPFVTVDGFDITDYAAKYSGHITLMKGGDYCQIINNVIRDGATSVRGIYFYLSNDLTTANNCLVRGNTLRNLNDGFLNINGANHTFENNTLEHLNNRDYMYVFGHGHVFRRNIFRDGNAIAGVGNHPDWVQTFGDNGVESYDMLFENNWIENIEAALGQLDAGGGPQGIATNIHDWVFRNNIFIAVLNNLSLGIPGTSFVHNTFYRQAYAQNGVNIYGTLNRGDSSRLTLLSNAFVAGGLTPTLNNDLRGFANLQGASLNIEVLKKFGTLEPAGTQTIATAIAFELTADGYLVNPNGGLTNKARALTDISQFVITNPYVYNGVTYNLSAYKSAVYDLLTRTVQLDQSIRTTTVADYDFVSGAGPNYYSKSHSNCSDGIFSQYNFCEPHGINGGNPRFANESDPDGPDNVPFTLDDGLKPLPGSPLCGRGQGGTDIGVYSCDTSKIFSVSNGNINYPVICTSFTYSSWGTCTSSTQTRIILSSTPTSCTGGTPVLTQNCTVSTPADFNHDGRVNTTDFSLLTNDWNKINSPYDLNGDHIVNSLDYVIMVQGWTG